MRWPGVVVILGWSVIASAQPADSPPTPGDAPPEPPAEELTAAQLTAQARVAARRGQCSELAALGERVRALDPAYYAAEFAPDRSIHTCVPALPVVHASHASAEPVPVTDSPSADGAKSVELAGLLSIGVPVAGVILISAAARVGATEKGAAAVLGSAGAAMLVVGPTLGHVYAGRTWNTGLKWRLITLGIAAVALIPAASCSGPGACESGNPLVLIGVIGFVGAGAAHIGATVYEMVGAPRAARRANDRAAAARVNLVPAVTTGPGVSLVGSF